MTTADLRNIIEHTDAYCFHSHTQYCDGRAPMADMAQAALQAGMRHYGFSPHSPLAIPSPCNMLHTDVEPYLAEVKRLQEVHAERGHDLHLYASMEIDRLNHDHAPHIDYYQRLPLDYRIGSVHFVESQDGEFIDCDGSYARFATNLRERFRGDLRYVVEKYFESVLRMLEEGGFDILGHADKIAANAAEADPELESYPWYEALIDDVVRLSEDSGVIVEVNTKAIYDRKRLFPARQWWRKFVDARIPLVVNSDAHYTDKINLGREEALAELRTLKSAQ